MSSWPGKALAALVFPSLLVVGVKFMIGNLLASGGADVHCSPSSPSSPYQLAYTNFPGLDAQLCGLVTFFHAAMHESNLDFLITILSCLPILAVIPYLEGARRGRSYLLTLPILVGILYQNFSVAIVMPIYWLIFIFTGTHTLHKDSPGVKPDPVIVKGQAEAILFSLFVGYIIPTACMIVMQDPQVTALWQAFPVLMSLANLGHRLLRPSSRNGYSANQFTLVLCLVIASSVHASTIWPMLTDGKKGLELFIANFVPRLTPYQPPVGLEKVALAFLQWDGVIGFVSTMLATLWFARDAVDFVGLLAWYAIATVALGPGAAIAGVFLWRESLLDEKAQGIQKTE